MNVSLYYIPFEYLVQEVTLSSNTVFFSFQLPADFYSETMKKIAATHVVKGRHCRSCWWPTIFFWIFFWLLAMVVPGIFPFGIYMMDSDYRNRAVFIAPLVVLICLFITFCGICFSCCHTTCKVMYIIDKQSLNELSISNTYVI